MDHVHADHVQHIEVGVAAELTSVSKVFRDEAGYLVQDPAGPCVGGID